MSVDDKDINELKRKIDHLEYDEIKEIQEEITNMKIELNKNSLLTSQVVNSNEKLSDTMIAVQNTMVEITQSLKDSNKISSELTQTVSNLNKKVDDQNTKIDDRFRDFDDKIEQIDNKSKVDIVELQTEKAKDGIVKYIIGGGSVGAIIFIIELISKFI